MPRKNMKNAANTVPTNPGNRQAANSNQTSSKAKCAKTAVPLTLEQNYAAWQETIFKNCLHIASQHLQNKHNADYKGKLRKDLTTEISLFILANHDAARKIGEEFKRTSIGQLPENYLVFGTLFNLLLSNRWLAAQFRNSDSEQQKIEDLRWELYCYANAGEDEAARNGALVYVKKYTQQFTADLFAPRVGKQGQIYGELLTATNKSSREIMDMTIRFAPPPPVIGGSTSTSSVSRPVAAMYNYGNNHDCVHNNSASAQSISASAQSNSVGVHSFRANAKANSARTSSLVAAFAPPTAIAFAADKARALEMPTTTLPRRHQPF